MSKQTEQVDSNREHPVLPLPSRRTGKNLLINGDFSVWQRGNTFSLFPAATFIADRWFIINAGDSDEIISRDVGQPGLSLYSLKLDAGTTQGTIIATQVIENGVYIHQGKSMTISYWIDTTETIPLSVKYGACSDSLFGTLSNPADEAPTGKVIGNYAQYSATFICPDNDGTNIHLGVSIGNTYVNSDKVSRISNIQLELGDIVTDFETINIADTIQLCEEYYQKSFDIEKYIDGISTLEGQYCIPSMTGSSTFQAKIGTYFRTKMRDIPTVTIYNGYLTPAKFSGMPAGLDDCSANLINTNGFRLVQATAGAPTSQAVALAHHWIAEAEI